MKTYRMDEMLCRIGERRPNAEYELRKVLITLEDGKIWKLDTFING